MIIEINELLDHNDHIMIISSYLDSFFTNIILTTISKDMNSSPVFPEGLRRRESIYPAYPRMDINRGSDINGSPMDLGNSLRVPYIFFGSILRPKSGLRVGMPGNHT